MTSAPRFATTQELDSIFENPAQEYYTAGRTTGAKGQGVTKLFCTAVQLIKLIIDTISFLTFATSDLNCNIVSYVFASQLHLKIALIFNCIKNIVIKILR